MDHIHLLLPSPGLISTTAMTMTSHGRESKIQKPKTPCRMLQEYLPLPTIMRSRRKREEWRQRPLLPILLRLHSTIFAARQQNPHRLSLKSALTHAPLPRNALHRLNARLLIHRTLPINLPLLLLLPAPPQPKTKIKRPIRELPLLPRLGLLLQHVVKTLLLRRRSTPHGARPEEPERVGEEDADFEDEADDVEDAAEDVELVLRDCGRG